MTTPQFRGVQAEQEWRSTSGAASICTDVSEKETKKRRLEKQFCNSIGAALTAQTCA